MRKDLSALVIVLALLATLCQERSSTTLAIPDPAPNVPVASLGNDKTPQPLLSDGELLVSFAAPSSLGQLSGARMLGVEKIVRGQGPRLTLQVRSVSDYRWTCFGEPRLRIEGQRVSLEIPTSDVPGPHIENYQESLYESRPVSIVLNPGTYEILLGGRAVGAVEVTAPS